VDANPFTRAREPQRAVADQPRAQQWRRFDVIEALRDCEAIALGGSSQFGVAAIDLVTGEAGLVAQIFSAAAAIFAHAARPPEPGHADPVVGRQAVTIRPPR